MSASRRSRLAWWLALVLLVVLGLWLRYRDVTYQVLGGDEYHSIRVAQDKTFGEILTFYDVAENSMPMSLYARALMDTFGLTEFGYRLPAILSGLMVLLSPLALRRRLGRAGTLLAVALLATSPIAIYYSFVGRPYGPATALLLLTIWTWRRWLDAPARGRTLALVLCGALAVFLHMLLLLPLGLMVALAWITSLRTGRPPLRRTVLMTVWLLLAGLALFGPGLPGLIEYRLIDASRPGDPTLDLVGRAFLRLAGEQTSTAWALLFFAGVGAVRLLRRAPMLGLVLTGSLPAVLLGMFLTKIYPSDAAWTRYLFLAWPPYLMLAGLGMAATMATARRVLATQPLLCVPALAFGVAAVAVRGTGVTGWEDSVQSWLPWIPALLLVVAAAGALRDRALRRPSPAPVRPAAGLLALALAAGALAWSPLPILQPGLDTLRVRRESIKVVPPQFIQRWVGDVPPFFDRLATDPDGGDIVLVWPYNVETLLWHPFIAQQARHRRRVIAVREPPNLELEAAGVHWANITDLREFDALVEAGARYLVVRLDADDVGKEHGLSPLDQDPYYQTTLRPLLVGALGPPVHSDDWLEIHDLRARHYQPRLEDGELTAIELPGGDVRELTPGDLRGVLDEARLDRGRLSLSGWALDPKTGQPADAILVVTQSGRTFTASTGFPRPGLGEVFEGESVERSGYQLTLPVTWLPDDEPGPLQIFAILGNRTARLGYGPNARWLLEAP